MPAPDARTRIKIPLNPAKVLSSSIPTKQLPRIFLSDVLFVLSLYAGKEWLLEYEVGVFWVVMRVLACGALGVLIWQGMTGQLSKRKYIENIEWSVLGTASLLLFIQQACLFTALYRLSSTRVILFSRFSSLWMGSLVNPSSARKAIAVAAALGISIMSDAQMNAASFWRHLPGYGALVLQSVACSALDHTLGVLAPSLGNTFSAAAAILGASIFAFPFYIFRTVLLGFPSTPVLPLMSLAFLPVIAYSLLSLSPLTERSLNQLLLTPQHFMLSYPVVASMSALLPALIFVQFPTWTDGLVAILLYTGMYPTKADTFSSKTRTPTAKLMRTYVKTILSNPESRKIFYFLMLNMCYMLVQMLYGVWTNSLGLISDAIHMAFDCMAIGVGLFASVMATWEPNERFTYGYGRIETLSGFANGIFLILISLFIVFEAIQRILDPPEMNTSQLLLVSTLGLAVNLFGMFAMGGHHHHGSHSHSHSHSHGHSHSHSPNMGHSHLDPGNNDSHHHNMERSKSLNSPEPALCHGSIGHKRSQSLSANATASLHHSRSHSIAVAPSSPLPQPLRHSHSHSPEPHTHALSIQQGTHFHAPADTPAIVLSDHDGNHDHVKSSRLSLSIPEEHWTEELSPLSPNLANMMTPITPSYKFGHDDHLKEHGSEHAPNLHGHMHAHAHGEHEGHSHNMRGVFLHVMADTLGSVGVIVSTLLIQFYGWTGFDPIASLFIAVLIAASVIPLVLDTGRILCLDVADKDVVIHRALTELPSIEGLASYSAPRFWPKDSSSLIGSIHIQLAPSAASFDPAGPHSTLRTTYASADRVVERVDTLLRKNIPGLEELTIQVEGRR
ncbi:hypothetical protein AX17_005329 [Amanita inopinata Kibby_2008]|nr:hypothetical protein AX17_005329 [Amanita inopinata Kibby_2008]